MLCSFCNKTQDDVTLMFAADAFNTPRERRSDVAICDECVELALIYQNKYMRSKIAAFRDARPKLDVTAVKREIGRIPEPEVQEDVT